jgi:hypothetical protein
VIRSKGNVAEGGEAPGNSSSNKRIDSSPDVHQQHQQQAQQNHNSNTDLQADSPLQL